MVTPFEVMNDYAAQLLRRYRSSGIMLDTNILLLYFVGSFDPQLVPKFKRTDIFAIEDYTTLVSLLRYGAPMLTTPNIITEVSNLLGQLPEHQKRPVFALFAQGVALLKEIYLPSAAIAETGEFQRFGVTDAGLASIARKYLIVTEDFRLSQYLAKHGIDVLNFNHIRFLDW